MFYQCLQWMVSKSLEYCVNILIYFTLLKYYPTSKFFTIKWIFLQFHIVTYIIIKKNPKFGMHI